MSKKLISLSKFLSFLLRHGADEYNLQMDELGFTSLDDVWKVVEKRYQRRFSRDDLKDLLKTKVGEKQRFEVQDGLIRALYGHSRVRSISYPTVEPPKLLYHGTNLHALKTIQETGILPMQRQYVHLSLDKKRAIEVASRRTKRPIILTVRALEAFRHDIEFYHPESNHFLAVKIPPSFIDFPSK